MEYLMTYGWAILVIVIVLAALIFLGTFNLTSKAPDVCKFQVGLHCQSWFLSSTNNSAMVQMINGYQQDMNVTQVLCQIQGETGTWTVYPQPVLVASQQSVWLNATNCYDASGTQMNFKTGDMYVGKFVVQFFFQREGPGMPRRNVADVKFTAYP